MAEAVAIGKTTRRLEREAGIVEAAREVFLEKGFERASVSEIAARVGVVEGLIFRYFPTKRDLLDKVMRGLYEPLIEDVGSGFARITGFHARLRFIVWRHIRVYTETPGLARLVLHEVRTGPTYATSVLHDLQLRYTAYLQQALQRAIADGEVQASTDYELLRSVVYGGLEHLLWPVLYGGRRIDTERVADSFTAHVLRGMAGARRGEVEKRLTRLENLVEQRQTR